MTTLMVELSPSLQSIVDERLDAIERVLLMTGVSRGERREILGEVEAHVFELLGRRTTGEPTREDVLAVLSQLDPPESYAPEGFERSAVKDSWSIVKRREPRLSLMAVGSAACGAFLVPVLAVSVPLSEDGIVPLLLVATILVDSIVGCCSLVRIHRAPGRLLGDRLALFATLLFPLVAINCLAIFAILTMNDLMVFAAIAVGFLALNGAIIYVTWQLYAVIHSQLRLSS